MVIAIELQGVLIFDVPNFSTIQNQLAEWKKLTVNVRTAKQAKDLEVKHNDKISTIEVNGLPLVAEYENLKGGYNYPYKWIMSPFEWIKEHIFKIPTPIYSIGCESFDENLLHIDDDFSGNPIFTIKCGIIHCDATSPFYPVKESYHCLYPSIIKIIQYISFNKLTETEYTSLVNEFIEFITSDINKEGYKAKLYPDLSSTNITDDKVKEIIAEVNKTDAERKNNKEHREL